METKPHAAQTRRDFLNRFFANLKEQRIAYVVMRNFSRVFTDDGSDVDLLAASAPAIFQAGLSAARETGHRLVQKTRFLNHSWVFWNGGESFTRIDLDTAVRWRIFPAADTQGILARRIDDGAFYIPHPSDESLLLRVNIAWRNTREPRYTERLAELGAAAPAPSAIRWALIRAAFAPAQWLKVARFSAEDVQRFLQRKSSPPGAVFQLVTAADFDEAKFRSALAAVFPPMKQDALSGASKALFKGGLALHISRVPEDAHLGTSATRIAGKGEPSRNFIGLLESCGRLHLANIGTGRMMSADATTAPEQTAASALLTMLSAAEEPPPSVRGCTVLLVGIDGAGKTTFARGLFAAVPHPSCRYFHWLPSVTAPPIFPWPTFSDLPRNRKPSGVLGSCFRLARNLIRARLAWFLRVQPLVRNGALVLLDRFVANYWLDALSVRWSGPAWVLRLFFKLLPKADVMLVLDAEPAILAARKGELTLAEITAQRERLSSLPALGKMRIILDATQSPEAVVQQALAQLESTWM